LQKSKQHVGDNMPLTMAKWVMLFAAALPCMAFAEFEGGQRNFVRGGYAQLLLNTKSGNAVDVTGPIVKPGDNALLGLLRVPALGLPPNVQADVGDAGSPVVSVGRFLDDYWALEGLLLALPFKHDVMGKGTIERLGQVATVKQLPPTLILHRYFGAPSNQFRPSVGLGLNYTRFFSAKATPALEAYTGGPTDVSLSPSTGLGAFAGGMWKIDSRWHMNVLLGYVDVKTTATLTTRQTRLSNTSPVLQDQPAPVPELARNPITGLVVNGVLNDIATSRGGNLGTFERKLDLRLNPYVFAVTLGYAF
jgi:outer membrane protein W